MIQRRHIASIFLAIFSDAAPASTDMQTIYMQVTTKGGRSSSPINGHGVFHVSVEGSPENNLQVLGSDDATTLLGAIESFGRSGDVFWVKLSFLNQDTKQISESAVMQVGFPSPEAKESDPASIKVHTTLFSKSSVISKLKSESELIEVQVKLKR